jgi:protein-S-isoprenylcysteine O-methyltransferase Ste14
MTYSGKDAFVALRGVIVATAFVLLWTWLATLARGFDPEWGASLPPWLRPIGYLLIALGAGLAATCVTVFISRGKGTPAPFDPPRRFVATGPYRWVRNPMYWGAVGVLLGAGFVVASPSIALLALLFWTLAHLFVVTYEEPALERRFGAEYAAYKATVNRWLPRL